MFKAMRVHTSVISDCDIAAELSRSLTLKVVIVIKTVLCLLGLFAITAFLRIKGTSWLCHPHTKRMFAVHVSATYLSTLFYLVCFVTDLFRYWRFYPNNCDYTLPFAFAFLVRLTAVIGNIIQVLSITAIAIERLYASIRPATYESLNSSFIKAFTTVLVIVLSIALCAGLTIPGVRWDEPASMFTIRTVENLDRFQIMVQIEVCLELAALLTFHFSLYLNFRKKISRTNYVAERYQVSSNKRVIVQLLPVFWCHFICIFITSFGLGIYPYVVAADTEVAHGVFLELVAIAPLYAVIMPVMMFALVEDREAYAKRVAASSRKSTIASTGEVRTPDEGEEHFKALQTLFSQPIEEKERPIRTVIRETARGFAAMCCCRV